MKTIFRLYLAMSALVIGLASCDSLRQEVNPGSLPAEPSKLVVACFISPQDSVLAVSVTRSAPVLALVPAGGVATPVQNATVTLSDGTASVVLRYYQAVGFYDQVAYYRADPRRFPIVAGRTYTLTVAAPDGSRVSATCTVPPPVSVESITLDSGRTSSFDAFSGVVEYYARLRWRDPAGQTNYYRVTGDNDFYTRSFTASSPGKPSRDTLIRNNGLWRFDNGLPPVLTDASRDGDLLTSARATLADSYYSSNGVQLRQPARTVTGYLLHTDVNYYRYHEAILRQINNGDNPFAEPAPIPTNIDGGLGCFGAYDQTRLSTVLK